MFSPYYGWARGRGEADPEDHCSINVALYGAAGKRWTMTERGRAAIARSAREYVVGPSRVRWTGDHLEIDIDEWCVPIPHRVRGKVRLHPAGLCPFFTALDDGGRHRWGPIAPCARVEVELDRPATRWQGHAYFDSNEGDEPIAAAFEEWDWSRAVLADGRVEPFEAPPRQPLPRSLWRIGRTMRSDPGVPVTVAQTLEDTPFYVRSVLRSGLLGERVTSMHETLYVPRLESMAVQLMLPFRMPRRRAGTPAA